MPGRIAQPRVAQQAAIAAALCVVLILALVRVWAGPGDGTGDVVLTGVRQVAVTASGGVPRASAEGTRLAAGDTVTTGPDGAATLEVDGRRIALDPNTTVGVGGPRSFTLRSGNVLVDRRRGPGLVLDAGAVSVTEVSRGGAIRIDRGYAVRLWAYAGRATLRTSTGRELRLPELHQVGAAGRALPDVASPLALTGHRWEAEVAPRVVDADRSLAQLARGIDAPSVLGTVARARVVVASLVSLAGYAPATPASEAVLPVAIGRAAGGGDAELRARALRSGGGSWGVVASLVSAEVADVASRLDEILTGRRPAGDGSAPGGDGGSVVAGRSPSSGPGGNGGPGGSRSPSPGPTPSRTPGPGPSPTPSPSPDPIEQLVEDVGELVPTPTLPAVNPPLG